MRRKEMQGDARRRKYPAIEALSKWLGPAREGPSQKGPQRGEHPPGGPWRKEASQHLRSLGEKKSVPVVPVIPINFEIPPFFSYYL